jgi:hypothetical protein
MTFLGPVSNAAHGGTTSPWFPMVIGVGGLAYSWFRYAVVEPGKKLGTLVMAWITFGCLMLVSYGLWEIFHL